MHRVAYSAAIVLLLTAPQPASAFNNAGELLSACEVFEKGMRIVDGKVFGPKDEAATQCWWYMRAVQELSAISFDGKTSITEICGPEESTLTQLIRTFNHHARTNPKELHKRAGLVIMDVLSKAYPCPWK